MFGWNPLRYWNTIRSSPDRSQIAYLLPFDTRQYLGPLSRRETVRIIEGLAQEFGIIKEGFRGIGRHVIGTGLRLQLNTADLEWDEEGEAQFHTYMMTPGRFDITGTRNGYDAQTTAIEQRVFRGEFFAAAVDNPRWVDPITKLQEPAWQLFDTNEIGTPEAYEEAGIERIFDGVELDANNFRTAFHVQSLDGHQRIPASAMVHWFQGTGINQVRGESDFAPVCNRLVDWRDLEALFTKHAKTHSAMAIKVKKLAKVGGKGFVGGVKRAAPSGGTGTDPEVNISALEKAFPGMIAYLGSDGEAELINSSSPSEALGKFITDVLAPNVFSSLGIDPEFFWQVTRAGGPAQRFILTKSDLLFAVLAHKLMAVFLNAVAFRFLTHRIRIGRLAEPKDPNWAEKMTWQHPAKLSIDRADKLAHIELLRNGTTTLETVYGYEKKSWRRETRQWIREHLVFESLAKDEGASPEQVAFLLARWRSPLPGAVLPGTPGSAVTDLQDDDPPPAKAEPATAAPNAKTKAA